MENTSELYINTGTIWPELGQFSYHFLPLKFCCFFNALLQTKLSVRKSMELFVN